MRKEFTNVVSEIFMQDPKVMLFLGDIGVYGFRELIKSDPNRAFNIGILEQAMIGIAAGAAQERLIPIVHTIAPFIVERALEQIKIDFAYQGLGGNLVTVGASFDYSKLGCTHHCPADITTLLNIPNIKIFVPGNGMEFERLFKNNYASGHLNYFRLSEHQHELTLDKDSSFSTVRMGSKATVIAVGPILREVMLASADLDLKIVYCNEISQVESTLWELLKNSRKIVIVEPYYSGGLFLSNLNFFNAFHVPILQIGVRRKFLTEYCTYEEMLKLAELDAGSIRNRLVEFVFDRQHS